jgi:hypothetical protein
MRKPAIASLLCRSTNTHNAYFVLIVAHSIKQTRHISDSRCAAITDMARKQSTTPTTHYGADGARVWALSKWHSALILHIVTLTHRAIAQPSHSKERPQQQPDIYIYVIDERTSYHIYRSHPGACVFSLLISVIWCQIRHAIHCALKQSAKGIPGNRGTK